VIKYLGSKKRLVPVLGEMFSRSGARTAIDMFTGTTRVAQDWKRRGGIVTAVDLARYSKVFADCWIATNRENIDRDDLAAALHHLNSVPGEAGYFTDTFCVHSRFFQPHNGERIDAIRNVIEADYKDSHIYPVLLTSLILAADKVDSTTGVQMAYVKSWAKRSFNDLELHDPGLIPGEGFSVHGDALAVAPTLGHVDIAYLDPPYNQHRYFANYHIWETLVAWDQPEYYGVACKRVDVRDTSTKSRFNEKRNMPTAFRNLVSTLQADTIVLSYNDESWIDRDELIDMCSAREEVRFLEFPSKRYVGAQIGVFDPRGNKVGTVSHLHNHEWIVVAGDRATVARMTDDLPVTA
jgi:adenine-specific DNA-methyltransferase